VGVSGSVHFNHAEFQILDMLNKNFVFGHRNTRAGRVGVEYSFDIFIHAVELIARTSLQNRTVHSGISKLFRKRDALPRITNNPFSVPVFLYAELVPSSDCDGTENKTELRQSCLTKL